MTPRVRAVVRAERIKRARGPRSPLWRRCIEFRERVFAEMSPGEADAAIDAVNADRKRSGWI